MKLRYVFFAPVVIHLFCHFVIYTKRAKQETTPERTVANIFSKLHKDFSITLRCNLCSKSQLHPCFASSMHIGALKVKSYKSTDNIMHRRYKAYALSVFNVPPQLLFPLLINVSLGKCKTRVCPLRFFVDRRLSFNVPLICQFLFFPFPFTCIEDARQVH